MVNSFSVPSKGSEAVGSMGHLTDLPDAIDNLFVNNISSSGSYQINILFVPYLILLLKSLMNIILVII